MTIPVYEPHEHLMAIKLTDLHVPKYLVYDRHNRCEYAMTMRLTTGKWAVLWANGDGSFCRPRPERYENATEAIAAVEREYEIECSTP